MLIENNKIHQKMSIIWTYGTKVHFKKCKSSYLFLVKIFLTKVLHLNYFFFGISDIESMQNNPRKIHRQKCIFIKPQTKDQSIFFNFKSPIFYI